MARTLRFVKRGYCYHLINRGNNRARLFHDAADYSHFLTLIREAQERVSVPLLAACLMPNHVHFVVRPNDDPDVSRWTQWLFTVHVKRYHRKYGTTGRLWTGRYKAFPIQQDNHLLVVMRYVERNPLRAGLVDRAETWPWGSLHWRLRERAAVDLAPSPVTLPPGWADFVNEPQTDDEINLIRKSVNQQRPFGERSWALREAKREK